MVLFLLSFHIGHLSIELALVEVVEEQLAHFRHRNPIVLQLESFAEVTLVLLFFVVCIFHYVFRLILFRSFLSLSLCGGFLLGLLEFHLEHLHLRPQVCPPDLLVEL